MEPAEPAAKRAKTEASSGVTLVLGDGTTMPLAAGSPLLVKSETLRLVMTGPIVLSELNGNTFEVHGCLTAGASADFRRVAAAQHPELRGLGKWQVLPPGADEATDTLDLGALRQMRLDGNPDAFEPLLVVWKDEVEGVSQPDDGSGEAAGTSAAAVAEVSLDRDGSGGVVTLSRCDQASMLPLVRLCTLECSEPEIPKAPTVDPFTRQWHTFSMSPGEKDAYTKKATVHTSQTAALRQFQQEWDPAGRAKKRVDAFFAENHQVGGLPSLEMLAKVIDTATVLGLGTDIIDAVCAVAAKAIGPEARKATEYVERARVTFLQGVAPPTVVDSYGRVAPTLVEVEQFCSTVHEFTPALLEKIFDAAVAASPDPLWSAAGKESDQMTQDLAAVRTKDRFWAMWSGGRNAAAADVAAEQQVIQDAIDARTAELTAEKGREEEKLKAMFDAFTPDASLAYYNCEMEDDDDHRFTLSETTVFPGTPVNEGSMGWSQEDIREFIVRFIPKTQPEQWFQVRARCRTRGHDYDARHPDCENYFEMSDKVQNPFGKEGRGGPDYEEDPSRPLTSEQVEVVIRALSDDAYLYEAGTGA